MELASAIRFSWFLAHPRALIGADPPNICVAYSTYFVIFAGILNIFYYFDRMGGFGISVVM